MGSRNRIQKAGEIQENTRLEAPPDLSCFHPLTLSGLERSPQICYLYRPGSLKYSAPSVTPPALAELQSLAPAVSAS